MPTNRFPSLVKEVYEAVDAKPRGTDNWVGVVIHHTGVPKVETPSYFKSMVGWLTKKDDAYVSAHFLIGRDGEIAQLVDPDTHIAYHAGSSKFWHPEVRRYTENWNRHSIGIELIGDGNDGHFTDLQYEAAAQLTAALMKRYPTINPLCIVGHEMLTPDGRKSDPGRSFQWQFFYRLVYKHYGSLRVI